MEKITNPPLENPSSCKVNGISIHLVVTSSINNDSKRSFGVVDWLSTIENEPHLLKLILG
jgi:hypothetical protein